MAGANDFNEKIIREFHENKGKVGGPFSGAPMVLLHSKGAKSGQDRINPLVYSVDGDHYVIAASKGGAPTNPDWYYNLQAHPHATIEVGTEKFDVVASFPSGAERDRLYAQHAAPMPQFLEYAKKTTREIPVVVLTRKK